MALFQSGFHTTKEEDKAWEYFMKWHEEERLKRIAELLAKAERVGLTEEETKELQRKW